MKHLFLLTIILDILHCYILEFLHIMWLTWRGCWRHCPSIFLYSSKNQQPRGLFFTVIAFPTEAGISCSLIVVSVFIFIAVPTAVWRSVAVLVTIFTFSLEELEIIVVTFSFLRCSMLEISLLIHPFPVFFFRSVMSSRINISLS